METIILVFFFSSRIRHTRWTGDWSSDVCSSDLLEAVDGRIVIPDMHVVLGHLNVFFRAQGVPLRLIRRILGGIGIGFARFVGLLGSSRSRGVGRLRRGPLLRILGVAEGRHLENAQSREPRKESLASHKSQ